MPSCAIPSCKNASGLHTKSYGITFHKCHSNDNLMFKQWCGIIRKCRNNDQWVPSKCTVVCSVHFDPNDIYLSETGRRHLHPGAIPKLMLNEPMIKQKSDESNASCTTEEHNSQSSTFQHCSPKLTVSLQQRQLLNKPMITEKCDESIAPCTTGEHHNNRSSTFQHCSPKLTVSLQQQQTCSTEVLDTDAKKSNNTKNANSIFFSCCKCGHSHEVAGLINTLTLLPQTATIIDDLTIHTPSESNSFRPPQTPYGKGGSASLAPDKLIKDNIYLNAQLKKKDLRIKKQANSIRYLNQKIRRFVKRKEELKKILVYMKEKYE